MQAELTFQFLKTMSDFPFFSVTIPAYKSSFLKECIDSVLSQTYKNYELIIVDDASPQNLDSIICNYSDSPIRYFKNKKGFGAENVVGNWNKCLEYAKGDYIICMGDDDRLLPNCLEEYTRLIRKYPGLGLYHAWSEQIDEDNNILNISLPLPERENTYSFIYARLIGRTQYIGDFAFERKKLIQDGGFYSLPFGWCSDDMSSFIASIPKGVAHAQIPTYQYRINTQSISSSSHNRIKMYAIEKEFNWLKIFMQNDHIVMNPLSETIRIQALKQLPSRFLFHVKYYMECDMRSEKRLSAFHYWMTKRKDYNYNTRLVIKNFLKSFI